MTDIEKFKKLHYYGSDGEKVSDKDLERIGLTSDNYLSLEESAYQTAYDLSNDWARTPEWEDVKTAYKQGVEDGINYIANDLADLSTRTMKVIENEKDKENVYWALAELVEYLKNVKM